MQTTRNMLIGIIWTVLLTTNVLAGIVIELQLKIGDTIEATSFRTALGEPDTSLTQEQEYLVQIVEGNTTKYSTYLTVEFPWVASNFVEEKYTESHYLNTATIPLKLPYYGNLGEVQVYANKTLALTVPLNQLCNYNNICEEHENYLSCEEDCPLNKRDNYCVAANDGVCDADCAIDVDPDCYVSAPLWKRILSFVLIILALIGIVMLVHYYIEKRTKHL